MSGPFCWTAALTSWSQLPTCLDRHGRAELQLSRVAPPRRRCGAASFGLARPRFSIVARARKFVRERFGLSIVCRIFVGGIVDPRAGPFDYP
jgi:hypothetical protein